VLLIESISVKDYDVQNFLAGKRFFRARKAIRKI